ncbi:MAG: hypothetical protein IPP19_01315 [Verrucomicrobia bacterium]|nr:hypothetical protein [Verrucomicrobiota bacterium]
MSDQADSPSAPSTLQRRLLEETPWHEAEKNGLGDPASPDYKGGIMRMHRWDSRLGITRITADGFERLNSYRPIKAKIDSWREAHDALLIEATEIDGGAVHVRVTVQLFRAEWSQIWPPESRRDVYAIVWEEKRDAEPWHETPEGVRWQKEDHSKWYFVSERDRMFVSEGHVF